VDADGPVRDADGLAALSDVPADMGSLRFYERSHLYGTLGRSFVRDGDDQPAQHPCWPAWHCRRRWTWSPGTRRCTARWSCTAPRPTARPARLSFTATYFDAAALYTGAAYGQTDGLGLELNKPFDHPMFPVIADA